MFDYIEKLRQKSDKSKRWIAFLSSFSFAGLIFVVWLSVIYPDFRFQEKQRQTASANEASPVGSFFSNMKEGFAGVKKQVDDMKDVVSGISSSTYYVSNNGTSSEADVIEPGINPVEMATTSPTNEEF
jgi:hypothetical protein